jgi:hypothetical protein
VKLWRSLELELTRNVKPANVAALGTTTTTLVIPAYWYWSKDPLLPARVGVVAGEGVPPHAIDTLVAEAALVSNSPQPVTVKVTVSPAVSVPMVLEAAALQSTVKVWSAFAAGAPAMTAPITSARTAESRMWRRERDFTGRRPPRTHE